MTVGKPKMVTVHGKKPMRNLQVICYRYTVQHELSTIYLKKLYVSSYILESTIYRSKKLYVQKKIKLLLVSEYGSRRFQDG